MRSGRRGRRLEVHQATGPRIGDRSIAECTAIGPHAHASHGARPDHAAALALNADYTCFGGIAPRPPNAHHPLPPTATTLPGPMEAKTVPYEGQPV